MVTTPGETEKARGPPPLSRRQQRSAGFDRSKHRKFVLTSTIPAEDIGTIADVKVRESLLRLASEDRLGDVPGFLTRVKPSRDEQPKHLREYLALRARVMRELGARRFSIHNVHGFGGESKYAGGGTTAHALKKRGVFRQLDALRSAHLGGQKHLKGLPSGTAAVGALEEHMATVVRSKNYRKDIARRRRAFERRENRVMARTIREMECDRAPSPPVVEPTTKEIATPKKVSFSWGKQTEFDSVALDVGKTPTPENFVWKVDAEDLDVLSQMYDDYITDLPTSPSVVRDGVVRVVFTADPDIVQALNGSNGEATGSDDTNEVHQLPPLSVDRNETMFQGGFIGKGLVPQEVMNTIETPSLRKRTSERHHYEGGQVVTRTQSSRDMTVSSVGSGVAIGGVVDSVINIGSPQETSANVRSGSRSCLIHQIVDGVCRIIDLADLCDIHVSTSQLNGSHGEATESDDVNDVQRLEAAYLNGFSDIADGARQISQYGGVESEARKIRVISTVSSPTGNFYIALTPSLCMGLQAVDSASVVTWGGAAPYTANTRVFPYLTRSQLASKFTAYKTVAISHRIKMKMAPLTAVGSLEVVQVPSSGQGINAGMLENHSCTRYELLYAVTGEVTLASLMNIPGADEYTAAEMMNNDILVNVKVCGPEYETWKPTQSSIQGSGNYLVTSDNAGVAVAGTIPVSANAVAGLTDCHGMCTILLRGVGFPTTGADLEIETVYHLEGMVPRDSSDGFASNAATLVVGDPMVSARLIAKLARAPDSKLVSMLRAHGRNVTRGIRDGIQNVRPKHKKSKVRNVTSNVTQNVIRGLMAIAGVKKRGDPKQRPSRKRRNRK